MSDNAAGEIEIKIAIEGDLSAFCVALGVEIIADSAIAALNQIEEEERVAKELEDAGKQARDVMLLAFLLGWMVGG